MTPLAAPPLDPCAPTDAAMGWVEICADDDLSIGIGDWVRYAYRGYGSFEGTVTAIDAAGRVEVQMRDEWGERCYWCAESRLTLMMCAEAAAVEGSG